MTSAELAEFEALPRKCRTETNQQQEDEHAQLNAPQGSTTQPKRRCRGKTSMGQSCVADSQTCASAVSAIAPSAARKRAASSNACNDRVVRQRVSPTAATKRAASAMVNVSSQPDAWRSDITILPELDAAILQQVRDLGRYPHNFYEPKTRDEKDEQNLYKRIKKNEKAFHNDTSIELEFWKPKDAYWWCENLRSAKQHTENWKQEQAHIDSDDERC